MKRERTLRTCKQGHHYYKSTDCPTCPVCEELKKPNEGFLSLLASPASRALMAAGINTVEELSRYTEKEILALHGMGRASMPLLKRALSKKGLTFKG